MSPTESRLSVSPTKKSPVKKSKTQDKENQKEHSHSHEHAHEEENINIKAAIIHVIGDIIQSIGVTIAALIIYLFGGTE